MTSHFLLGFYKIEGWKSILKEEGMKREQEWRNRINITRNIGQVFLFSNLHLSFCFFQVFISPDTEKSSFSVTSKAIMLISSHAHILDWGPYHLPYVWWELKVMALHIVYMLKLLFFLFHRFTEIKPGCLKVMLNWGVVKRGI